MAPNNYDPLKVPQENVRLTLANQVANGATAANYVGIETSETLVAKAIANNNQFAQVGATGINPAVQAALDTKLDASEKGAPGGVALADLSNDDAQAALSAMFDYVAAATITAAGNTAITLPAGVKMAAYALAINSNTSTYTTYVATVSLATANAVEGAEIRLSILFTPALSPVPNSVSPTLEIRNATPGGTVLSALRLESPQPLTWAGVYRFTGSAWTEVSGGWQQTAPVGIELFPRFYSRGSFAPQIARDLALDKIGEAEGAVEVSAPLKVGARRNVNEYTEDLSNARYAATNGASLATGDTINWNGITLTRFNATAYQFTQGLTETLSAGFAPLTAGRRYLCSGYIVNMADEETFFWNRAFASSGGFGHGARLLDGKVRRFWFPIQAVGNGYTFDPMVDPAVALGSGSTTSAIQWFYNGGVGIGVKAYIGGLQIEEIPTTEKLGLAAIGDSLLAGSTGGTDGTGLGRTAIGHWMSALMNCTAITRGVGGNTTAQMVARYATDITPLAANSKYFLIEGGRNDVSQGVSLATTQANLTSLWNSGVADGMIPVICTVTPGVSDLTDTAKQEAVRTLNSWIRSTFPRVIDLNRILTDPTNPARLHPLFKGDSTHWNFPEACRLVAEACVASGWFNFVQPTAYQPIAAATYTAPALTVAGGSIVSGTALTLSAGGTNQNVVLTPSGTGGVTVSSGNLVPGGNLLGDIGGSSGQFWKKIYVGSNNTTNAYGIAFGTGNSNLYRSAADTLKTDGSLVVAGNMVAAVPTYADDAAADADATLPSGALYRTTGGSRSVYRKP